MRNNRTAVESFDKEHLILNFACDMARGLQAMHQHNYVHRSAFTLRSSSLGAFSFICTNFSLCLLMFNLPFNSYG